MFRIGEHTGGGNLGHTFGLDSTDERSITRALLWASKSRAGSLAMFLASWVVVAAFTVLFQPARPLVQSLLLVPAAAAAQSGADPLAIRTKGSARAPVTVYEMSDFQCPFCRRHALETWPTLEKEYVNTGKVRWIFINFPLTSILPNAVAAHELAMCAGRQGKFWEAHELVFRTQAAWAPVRDPGPKARLTNMAYGGADRRTLYMVDSYSGSILEAKLPVPGVKLYSHL